LLNAIQPSKPRKHCAESTSPPGNVCAAPDLAELARLWPNLVDDVRKMIMGVARLSAKPHRSDSAGREGKDDR